MNVDCHAPPPMPSTSAAASTSKQFPQTRKQLIKELKFNDQKQHRHLPYAQDYYEMKADLILAERRAPTKQPQARLARRVDPALHEVDVVFRDTGNRRRASPPPDYELPIQPPRYRRPSRQTKSSPRRSSGRRRQRLWYSV